MPPRHFPHTIRHLAQHGPRLDGWGWVLVALGLIWTLCVAVLVAGAVIVARIA